MLASERRVLVPPHPALLSPPPARAPLLALGGATMGTTWSVKLLLPQDVTIVAARGAIEAALARVIAEMSQWEPGSDISRYNRAPAGSWHVLPEHFRRVLDRALALARDTGGAYDPTIGALVDLWGFGPGGPRPSIPDDASIAAALDRTRAEGGWQRVRRDGDRALQPGAARLDFASIAKGYAVDLVSEGLSRLGIACHLVEIGGELRGEGVKLDLQPWWVALEEPLPGAAETLVALHGLSVATSGDARRYVERGGRRYGHTLDPRTGYPIDDRLAAVTVLAPDCMTADALATALSVLGPEAGMDYAARHAIAARFLLRAAKRPAELVTPAFVRMMEA